MKERTNQMVASGKHREKIESFIRNQLRQRPDDYTERKSRFAGETLKNRELQEKMVLLLPSVLSDLHKPPPPSHSQILPPQTPTNK